MPLLDHFHPPLSERRHWEAFHARWAAAIADELNTILPEDYFAEAQVHHGARVEIDVGTFTESGNEATSTIGVAVKTQAVPALAPADFRIPAVFPEEIAVHVFQTSGGPRLIAAIELVSPANKDRPEHRQAFAIKCAAYLQQGIGLIVVDVVTSRHADLLQDLFNLISLVDRPMTEHPMSAVSFRPVQHDEHGEIELRIVPLAVEQLLPTLPLALDSGQVIMVDFEGAYMEARERSRL